MSCPEGTVYNMVTNNCSQKLTSNTTNTCSQGATYNNYTMKCECPQDLPYDNGARCLTCILPYFWN